MTRGYLTILPATGQRLRLFCFHHAGGAASIFTGWRAALPPDIDVLPVQLPGREARARDPLPEDLATLVADLDTELAGQLRAPYALYGHSMGGAVAYGLAKRRAARGAQAPAALLVGACPAPHRRSVPEPAPESSDADLVSMMRRIGGLSDGMLNHPEWLRAATNLLRADLRMLATEKPDRDVLPFPIHVFHATGDSLVQEEDMAAWARHTTAEFVLHRVSGGHFFVLEPDIDFLRVLTGILRRLSEAPGIGRSGRL